MKSGVCENHGSQTTAWKDFIAAHTAVLAGIDFFTVEMLTWRGLATYYVLFVIHLESRRVTLAGITKHPTEDWMLHMGRNATDESCGFLKECRYVLHDQDTKFSASFRQTLTATGVEPLKLPPRSPNRNEFAERWVRSVKHECLGKLILFGEGSLKRALNEFLKHYHAERPHQGKANVILFSTRDPQPTGDERVCCNARLGGLLRYYFRAA
jgi:putative transposase